MAQLVRIKHPEVDGEAIIAIAAVPGYAARGWLIVEQVTDPGAPAPAATLTRPAASASTDAWRTYAVAAFVLGFAGGLSYDDAMNLSRDQLAGHFANLPDPAAPAETPDPATPEES